MKNETFKNSVEREKVRETERAFTLTDLLVMIAVAGIFGAVCCSALAKTHPNSQAIQCMNNLRQLTAAWRMYADDSNDTLVSSESGISGRPSWFTGALNFSPANHANCDLSVDMKFCPLLNYIARQPAIFRCPADGVKLALTSPDRPNNIDGQPLPPGLYPRVRSISMSQVFGHGEWLDGSLGSQGPWRTYAKFPDIVLPAKTFVLLDEHPRSINDAAFALAMGGSAADGARFVDWPAHYHNGGGTFSFADCHVEVHRWVGSTIQPPETPYVIFLGGTKASGDSVGDVLWMQQNCTVHQ